MICFFIMIFCYFFSAPRTFSLTFRPFFISIWIPSLIPVITARRLNFCEGTLSVNTYTKVESFLNSTVLSGTASTLLARARTISAFALYPERMVILSGTVMAALISNWLAPFSSTPLGERYILVVHQIPCFVRLLKLFLPACLRVCVLLPFHQYCLGKSDHSCWLRWR